MNEKVQSARLDCESFTPLGATVRDFVTGFKGIAIARIDHLFMASEVKVQPVDLDDNGKSKDAIWFEESRIERCP